MKTPNQLRIELTQLLIDFEAKLDNPDLRTQVKALIPALVLFRDLGKSLYPDKSNTSARERIINYLVKYSGEVISGLELGVVSGISDYPRRIRELRVQFGWPIYSGVTVKQMIEEDSRSFEDGVKNIYEVSRMRPDQYLITGDQDKEAAHRWNVANTIRRMSASVQDKILQYLRENLQKPVTGEELRYVANNKTEWARRVRELRTEKGWPVKSKSSGRPDLSVGFYVLEADRQSPEHDRVIDDSIRIKVLERDNYCCRFCHWSMADFRTEDPRTMLELHHVKSHVEGGSNNFENLVTLCNVHHDEIHRPPTKWSAELSSWFRLDLQ